MKEEELLMQNVPFSQSRVIRSEILARVGVLAARPASAGMDVHLSFEM